MLNVKQGGIKYPFLSCWYDSTWDWTTVLPDHWRTLFFAAFKRAWVFLLIIIIYLQTWYGLKYSSQIKVIWTQFYGFKYSSQMKVIWMQFYGFKYSCQIQIWPSRLGLQNTPATYLQRCKTLPMSVLDITPNNLIVRLPYCRSFGECRVPNSLPSLPGPLWLGVVAPDRILSMGQIELNCVLILKLIVWNRTGFFVTMY